MKELIMQNNITLLMCGIILMINIIICCIMYIKIDNKYAEAYHDLVNYIENLLILNGRQTGINRELIESINDLYKLIKIINDDSEG